MIKMNDILKDDNKLLRNKSIDVKLPLSDEDDRTMKDMIEYIRASQDIKLSEKYKLRRSVGIAASQIKKKKKMIVIRVEYEDDLVELALINPKIISHSQLIQYLGDSESCLSVPKPANVLTPRYQKIKVVAIDYFTKNKVEITLQDFEAIVIQHEMDHLIGKLYYDTTKTKEELIQLGAIEL